jgi:hypothetical protein
MKFRRVEGQELISIDSYATYVHERAQSIVAIEHVALRFLYTGCIGFKFRTLARLSWLKIFVGFLSLSRQLQGCYLTC